MLFIQLLNQNRRRFITAILEFCLLFHFSNYLLIYVIQVAILYWNEGFYFLFHAKHVPPPLIFRLCCRSPILQFQVESFI